MEANYFTILYWFWHTSTWISHGCTRVPHPELPSHLPPQTIPLGHPSAPAPSILYHALNLDWWFISHDIIHVSMPFSQIIPPSPSPTESKRLFYTSVSLLLSRIQGYGYHLSRFHIQKPDNIVFNLIRWVHSTFLKTNIWVYFYNLILYLIFLLYSFLELRWLFLSSVDKGFFF